MCRGGMRLAHHGCLHPPAQPDGNGDGHVTGSDLALVLGLGGPCGASCFGHANCDNVVDDADLAIVLGAWTG